MKVPVAADGSRFTADLVLSDGSYRIGPKGQERNVVGYDHALEALADMEIPYWRRPNESSGMAGIVRGVAWV